jgi:hypothetical protein
MSLVVVERSFDEPVEFASVKASDDGSAGCREAYAVRFVKSYFSHDRRRMLCLFEAPDAEAVRTVQLRSRLPFDRVWTARVVRHAAEDPRDDAILVERTLPEPLDEQALREAAARGAWCLEQHGCRIAWSYLSPDGRRAACVFGAPDAESVRQSQKLAGMPFDRAWPATVHTPPRV